MEAESESNEPEEGLKREWPPPSDDFMDAVTSGGSIVADCELCGRTVFEDDERAGDWELGELERLRENADKEPDKYVGFTDRSVGTGHIDGKQVVTNCLCNGLRRFENFIWSHRHIIADYVAKRARRIAESACHDEGQAEFLKENVAREDMDVEFAKCQDCGGYFDKDALDERLYCPRCADMHPMEDGNGDSAFESKTPEAPDWGWGNPDDDNVPF